MFDIGFMELMLISIVALIVIGPERLPGAIRTATLWIGRAKRSFNQVKSEIEREINTDEIKRQLHNESILADLESVKSEADALVKNTKKSIDDANAQVSATLKQEEEKLKEAVGEQPSIGKSPADNPTTMQHRETPAAPVDDPASIDETQDAEVAADAESDTGAAADDDAEKEQGPVVDFYNNPPSGTIQVTGGSVRPTTSLDDETDSGRRS